MSDEIKRATSALVGLPMFRCTRAADLASFEFGEPRVIRDHKQRMQKVGDYALHVQCAWRITHQSRILVGKDDLYYPAEGIDSNRDFQWDSPGANRQDKLLKELFAQRHQALLVQRLEVGDAASLSLIFGSELRLDIFPDGTAREEHWRLFRPYTDEAHFIVRAADFST